MNLKDIRKEIDLLDSQITCLLKKRIALAIKTKEYKKQFKDKKREKEILNKIENPSIQKIYKTIFKTVRKIAKD